MFSPMHLGGWRIVAFLTLVLSPAASVANGFDPAAQFSPVTNPNGVWSYGYESLPFPSTFKLLTGSLPVPASPGPTIDSWQSPAFGEIGVLHNGTAINQLVSTSVDHAQYLPGELAMHPGPNDEYGVVQFTAPAAGFYSIQGTFEGIDTTGPPTPLWPSCTTMPSSQVVT